MPGKIGTALPADLRANPLLQARRRSVIQRAVVDRSPQRQRAAVDRLALGAALEVSFDLQSLHQIEFAVGAGMNQRSRFLAFHVTPPLLARRPARGPAAGGRGTAAT